MRRLADILDDYFANRELSKGDFISVLVYRETCIAQAAENPFKGATSYKLCFESQMNVLCRKVEGVEKILADSIKGRQAIELGPGCNPLHGWLFEIGASAYTGVELFYPETSRQIITGENANVVSQDALSCLLSQPDESAILVSSGVLNREIMPSFNYLRFLLREIYRVTPNGCITIHGTGMLAPTDILYFKESGFVPLMPGNFNPAWLKPKA